MWSFCRHRWSSNWFCCIDGNPSRNYPEKARPEEKKKRKERESKAQIQKQEGGRLSV